MSKDGPKMHVTAHRKKFSMKFQIFTSKEDVNTAINCLWLLSLNGHPSANKVLLHGSENKQKNNNASTI